MTATTAGRGSPAPTPSKEGSGWSPLGLLFLAPAAILLGVFLLYPTIWTILLSFNTGRGFQFADWVGLENYVRLLTADPLFLDLSTFPPRGALFNNVLWLIFFTGLCVFIGLIVAVMAGRVRYEVPIKAIVFLPMAIAATALGVIWRFVYAPDADTSILNAFLGIFDIGPISFLGQPSTVNAALIVAGVWGAAGFATVILSAALKSIPTEIMEAARTDGATEGQIFTRIIVPMLAIPIAVVVVSLVITVIKLFDIIFVMTEGGPFNTSRVIAFTMFSETFDRGRVGYGSAVAVIMLLVMLPIIVFNIRRFRTEAVQS